MSFNNLLVFINVFVMCFYVGNCTVDDGKEAARMEKRIVNLGGGSSVVTKLSRALTLKKSYDCVIDTCECDKSSLNVECWKTYFLSEKEKEEVFLNQFQKDTYSDFAIFIGIIGSRNSELNDQDIRNGFFPSFEVFPTFDSSKKKTLTPFASNNGSPAKVYIKDILQVWKPQDSTNVDFKVDIKQTHGTVCMEVIYFELISKVGNDLISSTFQLTPEQIDSKISGHTLKYENRGTVSCFLMGERDHQINNIQVNLAYAAKQYTLTASWST